MLEKFYPALIVDKVQEIDIDAVVRKGIRGLILDIDNTLVPQHVAEADENALEWIGKIKEAGLKACIVSNATKKRVVRFNEKLKLYAIHRALKPGTRAFRKAMRLMDLKPEQTAVIGDQIFTDVYGGNRAGLYTILVKPIHRSESFFVRLKRFPEKLVLARYEKMVKNKKKGNNGNGNGN